MKHLSIIFFAYILVAFSLSAQNPANKYGQQPQHSDNTYSVSIVGRAYGDSIVLRWMPDDAALWILGNKNGWYISRTGGSSTAPLYLNGGKPIKPYSIQQMRTTFSASDLKAGLLSQLIHNPNKTSAPFDNLNTSALFEYIRDMVDYQKQCQLLTSIIVDQSTKYADAAGLRFVDRNVDSGAVYEYTITLVNAPRVVSMQPSSLVVRNTHPHKSAITPLAQPSISQYDANRVLISWPSNPAHSGYIVEKLNPHDSTWVAITEAPIIKLDYTQHTDDSKIADLLRENMLYLDSVEPGQTVSYRVCAYDAFSAHSDWALTKPFRVPMHIDINPPTLIQAFLSDSNQVSLQWSHPQNLRYTSIVVAFSSTMDSKWSKVSGKLPSSSTTFADSSATTRGSGFYRLYVSDSLGNIAASNALPIMLPDSEISNTPQFLRASTATLTAELDGTLQTTGSATVTLSWNAINNTDILGYRVFSAPSCTTPFSEITPSIIVKPQFIDTLNVESTHSEVFYYTVAVDQHFNYSSPSDTLRVQLPDVVRPDMCSFNRIDYNDNTAVIKWNKGKSSDIAKYNVYSQPEGNNAWQWVSSVNASDIDSLIPISFEVPTTSLLFPTRYAVEAIDNAGNASGIGAPTSYINPTKTSNNITLTAKYLKKNTSVALSWRFETNPQTDFYGVIYRSSDGSQPIPVGMFSSDQTSFVDSKLPQASTLTYHILIKSHSGSSLPPSNPITVKVK